MNYDLYDEAIEEIENEFLTPNQKTKPNYFCNFHFYRRKVKPPKIIAKDFLNSFEERGNSLQSFLKDDCVIEPGARIFNTDLCRAYTQYCLKNGLEEFSKAMLYEMLSGVPGVTMKRVRIGPENRWGHAGVRLRN